MSKQNYIDRPPRIQPEIPSGEYEIPAPPKNERNPNELITQLAMPLISLIGYIFIAAFSNGKNMLMMVPMLIAVLGTSLLAVYTNREAHKKRELASQAYRQRLADLRQEMESSHEIQRIYYRYNYPAPEISMRLAADLVKRADQRVEDIRSGSRLWERRPTDPDFGRLRLGTGSIASTVTYKLAKVENWDDPTIRDAMRLAEDSLFVDSVPISIPIRQIPEKEEKGEEVANPAGKASKETVRSSIAVTGNHPGGVYDYIRGMLVNFTTYHSPTDTHLYVVGGYEARQHWRWAFSLPHCKEPGAIESLCFEDDQEKKSEKELDRVTTFWKNIRTILERRKVRLMDQESGADITLPFMLVVVDVMAALPEWSSLRDLESEAAVSLILHEGQKLGAAILFLVPDRKKVPSACQAVIETDIALEEHGKAVFRYAETGLNSQRYMGTADLIRSQDLCRDYAKALEPLVMRMSYGADLATSVTLFEMLGISTLDQLLDMVSQNWQTSQLPGSADWLFTQIGLLAGNEPRKLIFSAKGDGVHGLVAGSTGSGKSELLMSLIIGLCLNFDPSVVNFVLVDYKGGAAFEPFRTLPHCVDIVTNLEGSATARMFASIIAELNRRQRLNTFSDSKDIVHYRKKGLHQRPDAPPYPFLFIIIDEFAEMIAGNAEFKSQLESITRLGRALGVHLILAAQRPIGVTDQMRANIKFRICLRVETPDDSRELLRRPDAAYLPPGIPGRGYLQIGNENIELIQTAYCGGDYRGPQESARPNVVWLNRPKKVSAQKAAEPPKLYDVIVSSLADKARSDGSNNQWRPWPAFLPRKLYLESPIDPAYIAENDIAAIRLSGGQTEAVEENQAAGAKTPLLLNAAVPDWVKGQFQWSGVDWLQFAMRPVVGIIDNPYDARQLPLRINFPVGHAVLFGASGWGKTTFIRTLITSLVATHTPDELHIYILDLGGRNLISFKELPHVGAVITSDEDERITRLLRQLISILEKRQALLSEAGVGDIYAYNNKHPENPIPAILVAIDNFAEFRENHESLLDPLTALIRDSRAYGIHFFVTADLVNALPGKLFNMFTERMTLRMSDSTAYSEIVGRGVPDMGTIAGRGFIRVGNQPLEFQVALPVKVSDEEATKGIDEGEKLKQAFIHTRERWANAWKGQPPASIETLPIRVSLEKTMEMLPPLAPGRPQAVMGIDDLTLQPYLLDLVRQGPHFVIVGPPNSGKTTTLRTMVLSLALLYSPDEIVIAMLDLQRRFFDYGGKRSLKELPHVIQAVSRAEEIKEFVENLKVECQSLEDTAARKQIFVFIDNYESFSDEVQRSGSILSTLGTLAREYGTGGLHFVISSAVSSMLGGEDLKKQVASSSYGVGLSTAEAAERLNGRVPRALSEVELPAGRGFVVKSGRTSMIQLATPYTSDEAIESSLDRFVDQITERSTTSKTTWSKPTELPSQAGEQVGNDMQGKVTAPSSLASSIANSVPDLDLDQARTILHDSGLTDEIIQMFSEQDIITMAHSFKISQSEEYLQMQEEMAQAEAAAPASGTQTVPPNGSSRPSQGQ